MNHTNQYGGSTLAAVMLLLVMGLMLLTAQQRQLDNTLLLAVDQQRYLQAYNQAASALSWGMVQSWPTLSGNIWHCQQHLANLQACAKLSARAGIVLVRGRGDVSRDDVFWLYQLAAASDGGQLVAEKGGWLDFCPEKNEADCADSPLP